MLPEGSSAWRTHSNSSALLLGKTRGIVAISAVDEFSTIRDSTLQTGLGSISCDVIS